MDIMSNFLALTQSINYTGLSVIVILKMRKTIFESVFNCLKIFNHLDFKDIFTMSALQVLLC